MKTDRSNLPSVSKEPSACPGAGGVFIACAVDTALALPLVSIQTTFANESLEVLDRVTMSCTSSNQCNQQYSITAVTTLAGAITERYAYLPYGELAILNSSATPITSSAIDNRYTYTGREWDSALKLYHFRARMMSPVAGRFLGRDPIGYVEGMNLYLAALQMNKLDPLGMNLLSIIPFCPDWIGTSGCIEYCLAAGISLTDCTYICGQQNPPEQWQATEWKNFPGVPPGQTPSSWPNGYPGIEVSPPERRELPILWGEEIGDRSTLPPDAIDMRKDISQHKCLCRERYLLGNRTRPKSDDGKFPNPGRSGECSGERFVVMRYPGECSGKDCSGPCSFYYVWQCRNNSWAQAGHFAAPCN